MALSEYGKGGLWTFLEMVGLFHGLGGGAELQRDGNKVTIVLKREAERPARQTRRKRPN